jgi:hypothetical protein
MNAQAAPFVPAAQQFKEAELVLLTKDMLERLTKFERRAKEETPLKYGKLQRLIFGCREIKREIDKHFLVPTSRPFPVKLLLIANNVRDENFLANEIDQIATSCRQANVPVLETVLSKRQIAVATSKSMRQSVVAVINSDGAQELLAKIIDLL